MKINCAICGKEGTYRSGFILLANAIGYYACSKECDAQHTISEKAKKDAKKAKK